MINGEKKTCIVVTCFDESQPGFLDFSYRIKTLVARYQLTIISSFKLTQAELMFDGVDYIVINTKKSRLGWFSYLWRCAMYIRRQQPDLVILLHSMAAPIAIFLTDISAITYWNEHPTHVAPNPKNVSPVKQLSRMLIRWLMYQGAKKSYLTMPIGEAHQRDLIAHGCAVNKIQMIYMGVDQSFHRVALTKNPTLLVNSSLTNTPLRLLYVGSVQKDRGRDVMLEAVAIANETNKTVHLTIVGASVEQLNICQDTIQKLNIEKDVAIHGRVAGDAIPSFMGDADVGLCIWDNLPWYQFNPPTKLFEYLVAGLPVLASDIATHTQYVKHNVNGLIFSYDSKSLAMAIKNLWQSRANLAQMKQFAGNNSAGYLWANIEPQFNRAVNSVLQK